MVCNGICDLFCDSFVMVLEFSVMVLCDVVGLGLFLFYSFILFILVI